MNEETKKRITDINNDIIPEGYKKTKVGIVPVEWEVKQIGECLAEYRELSNDIDNYPVYSSSRKGLIPQSDYYDKKEAIQTNLGYKIVPVGYVTYRHMSDDDIFHFNLNTTKQAVLVSSEYPVFNAKKNSNLYYIISSLNEMSRFKYFCRTQKLGGTRTRLYFKNLSTYRIALPPLPEQQKIAEILSTQDKLIELQARKINQLKTLKKGYLQKMFPKKGCKYPELRFKGFTDAWEQRELGEVADIVGGGTPSTAISEYWDGDIDWYAPAEISDQIFVNSSQRKITTEGLNNSSAKMLPVGTVLFTSRAGIGKTAILAKEGCTNQGFQSIIPHKNELDSYFIFSRTDELKRYGETVGTGSTFVEVSGKQMANMTISIPTTMEEQQQIGTYFRNLDHLITLHQRKPFQRKMEVKFYVRRC